MGITFRIALRNLRLHWFRTTLIGILLTGGTFLFVFGGSALTTINAGMRHSAIDSLAGDIQVYSATAKDQLELYGSMAQGVPDLGQIDDFSKLKAVLEKVPEVKAVVPMGLHRSIVFGNSMIDIKLTELRRAVSDNETAKIAPLKTHVRLLLDSLEAEVDKVAAVAAETAEGATQKTDLARAKGDPFWAEFDQDPLAALEFLDNKVAPIGLSSNMYFLSYVGVDPQAFKDNFQLFEVIEGQMIPPGERGFMFNTLAYERFLKHPVARGFDVVAEALAEGRTIANDTDLQRAGERMVSQSAQVTDQVDPAQIPALVAALQAHLGSKETALTKLTPAFLAIDDANFATRKAFFYKEIAPRIRLYAYRIGDTLALQSQTKSGYFSAVNVKIWGVFRFKGLEKSTLAGFTHVMDLNTFRDIYGLSNPVSAAEVEALKAKSGIKAVSRETAEADLFGSDDAVVGGAEVATKTFDDTAGTDIAGLRRAALAASSAKYTQAELEHGPIISAAVFLKEPEKLEEGVAAVDAAVKPLGAQAVPWNVAVGRLVGGFVATINGVFGMVVGILMLVVILVIALGLALSTMQRLKEIGTMRAIGASRLYVIRMIGVEAVTMGLGFGLLGAIVAIGLMALIDAAGGVPATSDMLYFVFGGATLKPDYGPPQVISALMLGLFVSLLASIIPAVIAARVKPITAMQSKE